MGFVHKAFVATALATFLIGTSVATVLPRRAPEIKLPSIMPSELIIPVEGVTSAQLVDTWGQARSEGRKHEGIDIMARYGTPVRATADGVVAKLFFSKRGGTTLYQFDRSGRLVYYYAHLSAYAAGLKEGDEVRQGQLIAYVGATGNATTPHLHFEIQRSNAGHQWWRGASLNPYMPLKTAHLPPEIATVAAVQ